VEQTRRPKTNDPEMQSRVLVPTKEEINPSVVGMPLEGGPTAMRRAASEWVLVGRRGAGSGQLVLEETSKTSEDREGEARNG
jgi:hypothetical protein